MYTIRRSNRFKTLPVYRHVQLLTNLSNSIQQKGIIPGLLVECTTVSGVILAFLVQTPASSENLLVLLTLTLTCVDCVLFILLCLGTLAIVYKESRVTCEKIRLDLASIVDWNERKWTQKFLKSCSVLKMKLGGSNFVEELTPLNCLDNALQIAVQILLLRRQN